MIRLGLVAFALLSGCAGPVSSAPPDSRIDIADGYAEDALADASLAVVLGPVSVTDEGVAMHLGGSTADMDATYRAFFASEIPDAFAIARVGEVTAVEGAALGVPATLPPSGTRFESIDADFVLLLDTLHVDRATYYRSTPGTVNPQTGMQMQTTTKSENLRVDTDVVLWDNRRGALVAGGRLDTERGLSPLESKETTYKNAVREFVEQLARFTPLALR